MYGAYGRSYAAQTAGKVALTTVSTTASVAGTAASLAAAAGLASVPVAGWIAAAGIGITAGTIQLVAAIRQGKIRKAEAIAKAKELGIADAELIPGYTVKALEGSPAWIEKQTQRLLKKYQRQRRNRWKTRAKLVVLGAVAKVNAAAEQADIPPEPSVDIPPEPIEEDNGALYIGLGVALIAATGYILTRGSNHE